MSAFLTGSGGFIGKAIVKELNFQGVECHCFDQSVDPKHNILDRSEMKRQAEGATLFFHIAGVLGTTELMYDPIQAIRSNVEGTANLLEIVREAGNNARVFYPTKPNNWSNIYSITKKAGEDLVRMYSSVWGMEVKILRWLNAYGPYQKLGPVRKAVPTMICQALAARPIEIWGTGAQPVDLIHVDDLAKATVQYVLDDDITGSTVRDTGLSIRMTVTDLAELICELTSSSSPIIYRPMRLGEELGNPVCLLEGATAADIVGLSTPRPLVEGLSETIEYYRNVDNAERARWLDEFDRRGW